MSSRIYRADFQGPAIRTTPVVWRSAEVVNATRATPAAGPPGGSADPEPGGSADSKMESRIRAAFEQGRVAGAAAGEAQAVKRLDPVLATLTQTVADLAGLRVRLRQEAERDLVDLAIAIARRVLHREIATDSEAILGLVKSAFDRLNARETHRLRVSPAAAAVLSEHRDRLGMPARLEIAADSRLEAGGAVFETSRGELDASVGTQLAEIQRGLADRLRRQAG